MKRPNLIYRFSLPDAILDIETRSPKIEQDKTAVIVTAHTQKLHAEIKSIPFKT